MLLERFKWQNVPEIPAFPTTNMWLNAMGSAPCPPPKQHFLSSTLDRQHQSTIHDNITIKNRFKCQNVSQIPAFNFTQPVDSRFVSNIPTTNRLCLIWCNHHAKWTPGVFFRNAACTLEIRDLTLNMLQNAATDKVKIQGWKYSKYGANERFKV